MRRFESVETTMKKIETPSDTQVDDGSYVHDPTKRSQRNGYKSKPHRPRTNNSMKEGKPSVFCNKGTHPRDKCPAKDAMCNFCKKQGHFERACLRRKARAGTETNDKDDKRLHNVNASSDHQIRKAVDMKITMISNQ